MSAKRRATTDLNHDNWDKDEKEDEEEMGNFKMAPEDVLEKRVIKTAKRRSKIVGDEIKKPVFSGFSGFNKTQPSSFDFLANLTNGSKSSNNSPAKAENLAQLHSTSESIGKISSSSIFTTTNMSNSTFGKQSSASVSMFGSPSSTANTSVFGTSTSTVTTTMLEAPISAPVTSAFSVPSTTAVSSVFGTLSSTAVPSVFGTLSATTVSSVFGASSFTATSSVFGAPSTAVTSVFKSPSTAVTSVFKAPSTTVTSVFKPPSTAVTSVFKPPSTAVTSVFKPPSTAVTSVFKAPSSGVTSIFGSSPKEVTSVFVTTISTATKADSKSNPVNENPFKIQVASTTVASTLNTKPPDGSSSKVTSSIFGTCSSINNSKSPVTSSNFNPFQTKLSTNLTQTTNTEILSTKVDKINESNTHSEKVQDKKLIYYSKLRGLNESVSEWITKHVQETPLCILTPIFKDYETHLKEIQEEYKNKKDGVKTSEENATKNNSPLVSSPLNTKTTVASNIVPTTHPPKSIFGTSVQISTQSPNFSFGFTSTPGTNTTSSGFSFGVNSTQSTKTTASPFAISNPTSNTNGKAPFSFGIEKPFNFNSNIKVQSNTEQTNENPEEEDQPPKVEFTPLVEENSIFDKRCKIFVKKDGNFVDKGVGTLYVKKIQDSMKYQLLVRANTNLGNVLLNLILSSSIPTQRMGKNNVMLVCVPTPEAKPPPVPVLIRVKTSEEADDLLKTLDKYKV